MVSEQKKRAVVARQRRKALGVIAAVGVAASALFGWLIPHQRAVEKERQIKQAKERLLNEQRKHEHERELNDIELQRDIQNIIDRGEAIRREDYKSLSPKTNLLKNSSSTNPVPRKVPLENKNPKKPSSKPSVPFDPRNVVFKNYVARSLARSSKNRSSKARPNHPRRR